MTLHLQIRDRRQGALEWLAQDSQQVEIGLAFSLAPQPPLPTSGWNGLFSVWKLWKGFLPAMTSRRTAGTGQVPRSPGERGMCTARTG